MLLTKVSPNRFKPSFPGLKMSWISLFQRWASKKKVANKSQVVEIPAVVTARSLSKITNVPIQKVLVWARQTKFSFFKASELLLDFHHASEFAHQLGKEAVYKELDVVRRDYWDPENNDPSNPRRPMVVSVMGHVDHGKTTLMDHLRKTRVAETEPGKITQSLTAFTVNLKNSISSQEINQPFSKWKYSMTMLDTPGHADFFLMRENGASVSDCLVLIIAANEGLKPQTSEVLSISADSNLPVIVCINKIDVSSQQEIERLYTQLHQIEALDPKITHSNNPYSQNASQIEKESDTVTYPVKGVIEISALNGTNIEVLIRALFEKADLIDDFLHPDPNDKKAEGTVIESNVIEGIGKTLRVVVHWGYLEAGQWFVTDRYMGRIKCLYDDKAQAIDRAYPGDPVSVAGMKSEGFPPTGSGFFVLSEEEAEMVQEHRENLLHYKFKEMHGILFKRGRPKDQETDEVIEPKDKNAVDEEEREYDIDEDGVLEEENAANMKWKRIITIQDETSLPIIIKADNIGRLETLLGICDKLAEEGDFGINIVANGVGNVTIADLQHAQIEVEENNHEEVPLYCFGEIGLDASAKQWLNQSKNKKISDACSLRKHRVIYDLIDDIKSHLHKINNKQNQVNE